MSVKIHTEGDDISIPARDLKPGLLAEIVEWDTSSCVGTVVQVAHLQGKRILIDIGNSSPWEIVPKGNDCRVRILPNKTLLEINQ